MSDRDEHLSTLYYRNPYLLGMTILILIVAGASAIATLPRLEDPRITLRNIAIITFLPGASAERVEALVNEKIEEELEEIEEIKEIKATARADVSFMRLELEDKTTSENNEEIFSKIRNRLKDVESRLPAGASSPFLDEKRGAIADTLVTSIEWNGEGEPPLNILNRLALELKDDLLNVPKTEIVRIYGGVEEEITVVAKTEELAALGLSAEDIARLVEGADSKVSAGQLRGERHDLKIEVRGALDTVDRIEQIPIARDDRGVILKLGDIARVERGYKTPLEQVAIFNQKRVVFIAARSNEDARVDVWVEEAQAIVDEFAKTLDSRFSLKTVFNQSEYTIERLSGLVENLVAGACIIIVIVFLTMGWKSGLIVGSALPLSIFGALFSLNFFDEGIHQMSIFGMIIAIGLLIDSAIVMSDEIRKRMHHGIPPMQAMEEAVRYLFVPLLTSTFTTILGFMPIFLLPGNAGDFVSPLAISVVSALCFSFFMSMTVVPALTARFSRVISKEQKSAWWRSGLPSPRVFDEYRSFLVNSLRRARVMIFLPVIPAVLGFMLIPTMPVVFFPESDRDMFEIQLWATSDSSIDHTLSLVERADKLIHEIKGVEQAHWTVGSSIPPVYYNQIRTQDRNSAYAQGVVVAESSKKAHLLIGKIQNVLNRSIPEGQFVVKAFAQGPPADAPVAFRLIGPNIETLYELGEQVRAVMLRFPEIAQTRATISGGQPKLWLEADEANARQAGLKLRDISRQFETNLEGFAAGSVLEDIEELPVRVRVSDENRSSIDQISNLKLVTSNQSEWIPAQAIGKMTLKPEIESITRYNGQRANEILGFTTPDTKAVSASQEIYEEIKKEVDLPPGYSLEVTGESEQQDEAIENLLIYAPVLIALMITALVLTFRSIALAAIIALVGMFSVGLGMLALKISGYPFGFNPILGSIGLVGVAINDTIVILSAIKSNPKATRGNAREIVKETLGCGRHVLSTTLTTIGGFIPLLLFSGGTFWPPLSVVIAGGLGFALILAMYFTPLAYKIFADLYYQSEETA